MSLFYNNVTINVTITGIKGINSKLRYRYYDNSKFTLYFCPLSGPSNSGICNGFFISSCTKKQDCLNLPGQKKILFIVLRRN